MLSETVYEYEYDSDGNLTKGKEYVYSRLNSESECMASDGVSILAKYT